ncbi:acyl carrier protein [Alphaproteobacteria bacterium]|jgi:acyl carrier protein|nr:acyl carrier protein [Alphaproteobacteria bacterium]|tara:strand:+ start:95 stop:346 length:252 start_codon:yes stop_codon:yes gene_type:complete
MKDDEILKRLNEVFCDVMDDEAIVLSHSTNASDIEEWDSLNQIKIILACEKEFGVRLNARDINLLENVGAMIEHLRPLVANKS